MRVQALQRVALTISSIVFVVTPNMVVTLICLAVTVALLVLNKIQAAHWQPPENGEASHAD